MTSRIAIAQWLSVVLLLRAIAWAGPDTIEFPEGKTEIKIPLLRAGDRLMVPVRINGRDAGPFVLDTGTTGFVLDSKFAQAQKFPPVGDATIEGATKALVGLEEIEIGGVKFRQRFAESIDLSKLGYLPGVEQYHGIVGGEFLKNMPFTINWSAATLALHKEKPKSPANSVQIPIWMLDDRPAMNLALASGISGWFVFNTGAEFGFELTPDFANAHSDWLVNLQAHRELGTLVPITQPEALFVNVQDVKIAGLPVPACSLIGQFKSRQGSASVPPAAGCIGSEIMRNFEICFDYKSRAAWIRPDPNKGVPAEWANPNFDPNMVDMDDFTPLMQAARIGRIQDVQRFLAAGANVNAKDSKWNTALHYAAENPNVGIAQMLVSAGASTNITNHGRVPPLLVAAACGNAEVVKLLLAHSANVKAIDMYGRNALILAAADGNRDAVAMLIKAGSDLNVMSALAGSALNIGAARGRIEATKLLLEAGADINQTDQFKTPLLFLAAIAGAPELVDLLLHRGMDPNAAAADGETALFGAAMYSGDARIVRLLLDHGADPNLKNKNNETAAAVALKHGHDECARILYYSAASPSTQPVLVAAQEEKDPVEFPKGVSEVRIQLVRARDKLLVPVRINGGDPVLFDLDTGDSDIDIAADLALKMSLPIIGDTTINGKHASECALAEVDIGGVKLHQTFGYAIDLTSLRDSFGLKQLQGLIGAPLLRNRPFTINWAQATLTIYNDKPAPSSDSTQVPIWLRGDQPQIQATLHGEISDWFLLDTGDDGGFTLEPSFARWNINWLSEFQGRLATHFTLGGNRYYRVAQTQSAIFAGVPIPRCELAYPIQFEPDSTIHPPKSGNIGQNVLRNLDVTLDYRQCLAWIKRDPNNGAPAEWADANFDSSSPDISGYTPLMRAAEMGRADYVIRFLAGGAPVDARDSLGWTALHRACDAPGFDVALLLIAAGADVNAVSIFGNTPLQIAAQRGRADIARLLVEHGASVNAVDKSGSTPLIDAVEYGSRELVALLIKAGANLDILDPTSGSALDAAAWKGQTEAAKCLLESGADPERNISKKYPYLIEAADGGSSELVRLLIDRGMDVNVRLPGGETALIMAAHEGHADVIQVLLDHGADPNLKDSRNDTALSHTLKEGHLDCARILYFAHGSATSKPAAIDQ